MLKQGIANRSLFNPHIVPQFHLRVSRHILLIGKKPENCQPTIVKLGWVNYSSTGNLLLPKQPVNPSRMLYTKVTSGALFSRCCSPIFSAALKSTYVRPFSCMSPILQEVTKVEERLDTRALKLSNELYAVLRVHNRPYLVTLGDRLILPFKLKKAEIGDVLNFDDVTTIGSRNYKLVDDPIDASLFTLKATVLEKTKRAFQVREVTKRRNRKVRHAKSKGDLTVLRISELKLN